MSLPLFVVHVQSPFSFILKGEILTIKGQLIKQVREEADGMSDLALGKAANKGVHDLYSGSNKYSTSLLVKLNTLWRQAFLCGKSFAQGRKAEAWYTYLTNYQLIV